MTDLLEALLLLLAILVGFNVASAIKLRRARKMFEAEVRAFKLLALGADDYRICLDEMVRKVADLTAENSRLVSEVDFFADLAMKNHR